MTNMEQWQFNAAVQGDIRVLVMCPVITTLSNKWYENAVLSGYATKDTFVPKCADVRCSIKTRTVLLMMEQKSFAAQVTNQSMASLFALRGRGAS